MSKPNTIVLYIEDEETDRLFMKRAFAKENLQDNLRLVNDGQAALDYLSGAGEYKDRTTYPVPDLVLLDLNLPEIHGFEVLKWIRNHQPYTKTPVVVFSSSGRETDQGQARSLGANEYIPKPASVIRFRDVAATVKARWLAPKGDEAGVPLDTNKNPQPETGLGNVPVQARVGATQAVV